MHHRLDSLGGHPCILVLPDPHNRPPGLPEPLVGLPVPFDVPGQLRSPPTAVRPGLGSVDRTGMPEAAVHHHDNPGGSEHQVGGSSEPRHRSLVQSVSQSPPVKRRAQGHLGAGAPRALRGHPSAHRVGGRHRACHPSDGTRAPGRAKLHTCTSRRSGTRASEVGSVG
jgi:hypothetical protein